MSAETAEVTKSFYDIVTNRAWRALFSKYRVKIVESWNAREGHGMNAELYRSSDNKKIADIHDDGNGGCMTITRFHKLGGPTRADTEWYDEFLADVKTLPGSHCEWRPDEPLAVSDELAITTLAELDEFRNIVKKARGKLRVLFVLPSHEDGQVGQWDMPSGTDIERAKAHIQKTHPDAIVLNEELI